MLPADWRKQMTEVVRGAQDPDPDWFAGGVVLSPAAQIEVYREQYRLRLGDALRDEVPGLVGLIGDDAAADELLFAYLADHPSETYTLNRIADRLVAWLDRRDVPDAWRDMARLDRAVMDGFEAADGTSLQPEHLITAPELVLQPHVSLLRLSHAVHGFRSAVVSAAEARPEVEARPVHLVVFRRNFKMRHLEVVPSCFEILRSFESGAPLGEALDQAVARGADPEVMQARLADWFKLFAERDLVQIAG